MTINVYFLPRWYRFADLKDPEKKHDVLASVVRFLGFETSMDRVQCAFMLADRPDTHRSDQPDSISKVEAFEPNVCQLWSIFGAEASYFGYGPFKGEECQ